MKKSCKIFILFLLMSMSVFSANYKRVELKEISAENYNKIEINLLSITNKDLEWVDLLNVKEVRDGVTKNYDPIKTEKIEFSNGDKVTIDNYVYEVWNNQIRINEKYQFVYKWNGSYDSKFSEEEGKMRIVSFKEKRYFKSGGSASKLILNREYREPIETPTLIFSSTDIRNYRTGNKEVKIELDSGLISNGTISEIIENVGEETAEISYTLNKNKTILTYISTLKAVPGDMVNISFNIKDGTKIAYNVTAEYTVPILEVEIQPTTLNYKTGNKKVEIILDSGLINDLDGGEIVEIVEDETSNAENITLTDDNKKLTYTSMSGAVPGETVNVSFNINYKDGIGYRVTGEYTVPTLEIDPTSKPSKQWIYSQITEGSLVKSDNYIVDFKERLGTIKTIDMIKIIDEDRSLEKLLKTEDGYSNSFKLIELERYEYNGEPKSIVEFKINSNIGEPEDGKFELTIVENNVFKRKINESYVIPVPTINFKEEKDLELSKNTFTYKDNYELEHIKVYNYQEVVFRLYTGSRHDEVRPIKRIEDNDLNNIKNSYVDFVFENNGSAQEIEKNGIKGRFIEGKFELMGLENKSYNLDFYTLRYRAEADKKTGNYVAVTYEGSIVKFKGKNISSTEDAIWLEDIDISDYKNIQLNMTSITTQDVKAVEVLSLIETRNMIKDDKYNSIKTTKQNLKKVWIKGKEYPVVNNKIVLYDGTEKYAYKWSGAYITKFILKEGNVRNLDIGTRRTFVKKEYADKEYADTWLRGKYIEPTTMEPDSGDVNQWVIFGFNPEKEFKNQDYKIEDRISASKRGVYKRLKTIDESNIENILEGKSIPNKIDNFKSSGDQWNYPSNNRVGGLIIEKTETEIKADLIGEDKSILSFYTNIQGEGIEKLSESGDKSVFRWNKRSLLGDDTDLSYDKVIFRIIKANGGQGSQYLWNPYDNANPINSLDDGSGSYVGLEGFLSDSAGSINYIDFVINPNVSKKINSHRVTFAYESVNNELRLVGLPVGEYYIQFYEVKNGHDSSYKVITYNKEEKFNMDISIVAGEEFEKENKIQKIDFITTDKSDDNEIRVNVQFVTKMDREIKLDLTNLESTLLPGMTMAEKNMKTSEIIGLDETNKMVLKEFKEKKFLFPLDIVFVIDNSGSMQKEIDNVKSGLTAFSEKLYKRGFDVKYNLITFGPEQTIGTIRSSWKTKVNKYLDYNYYSYYNRTNPFLAIFKDKWFDGSKLGKASSPKNDLAELIDAFGSINAGSGYVYGQENSALGIHYAIEKLRKNGRFLGYSGEITDKEAKGYMASKKMIILLTDENMDTDNIDELGYTPDNVLSELSKKLAGGKFNGMPDVIDLNALFHIRKDGNTTNENTDDKPKFYEKIKIDPTEDYEGSALEYQYINGYNERKEEIFKKRMDK